MVFKRALKSFALLLTGCGIFWGANPKLSPDLQSVDPNAKVRVIVQYVPGGTNSTLLGGLVNSTLSLTNILNLGGVVNLVSDVLNTVICTVSGSSLDSLANDATVSYISPDRTLAARLDYTSAAINASTVWKANLTGRGIGVAIIDSGIAPSPDLAVLGLMHRVVFTEDFTGGNGTDQYGHGTHVAGIVGASGVSSQCPTCTRSLVGMAPNASLISLRVLDANGQGSDSSVIAAIDRAIKLKSTYNIRVINLSLGRPIYESYIHDPLCQAVEAAWKAGIVVVAAAGNDGRDNSVGNNGYGTIESPGNDPYVITVGAMKAMGTYTRTDDLIASYSSKGPTAIDHIVKPDIVAPGNHVVSLLSPSSTLAGESANSVPLSYYESTASSTPSPAYLMLNGTSMATPVVSGIVADLLQAHPSLKPDQVKARLMKTAYKTFPVSSTAVDPVTGQNFVGQYDIFTIGAGYLDGAAALANSEIATGTALSPKAVYDPASGFATLSFNPSAAWNDTAVWGETVVWGQTTITSTGALWGAQAAWGTGSPSGSRAVWGTSGVWGAESLSGTRAAWGTDSSSSDSDLDFTVNQ